MHGSFEDRPGVPDVFLAKLSPEMAGRHLGTWRQIFSVEEDEPQIAHLHHLTPLHDAAFDLWSTARVVTHLHGTELKMIETIRDTAGLTYDEWWIEQMRKNAERSSLLITISPHDRDLALELLSVSPDKVVTVPNGTPGSIAYSDADLRFFRNADGSPAPVLLFVGRFIAFKRIDVLLEAYEMFRADSEQKAPLVIWGGFPGEWEGEHPYEYVTRRGIEGVFFAGWRGHDDLPVALASADVFVAPSVDEPFGQVYLEAMACGLPVIATATGGPKSFVNVEPERETGWLVEPGDAHSLKSAMVAAVDSVGLRETRGRNARRFVEREYSWDRIADQVTGVYESVMSL